MLTEWPAFDPQRFQSECRQRRPLLVRGWIRPEPLDRAGMLEAAACEELGARLVRGRQETADWQVEYGPFSAKQIPPNAEGK